MQDPSRLKNPEYLKHTVLDFRQMSAFVEDPFIIDRAEGVRYWDVDGKSYLDALSGIFVVSLGHRNRRIIEAMKAQLEQLCFVPTLHAANAPAVELSAALADITPADLNTVKLVSSGSEATETAMKLARQYWKQAGKPGRYKFISRYYGYHGATMGAMAASGTPARRAPFEPFPTGYVHVPTVHCYNCPYGRRYPDCGIFCAEFLRQIIAMEGPDTVAAVIVEPIGNTGGILVPPPEYLPALRAICNEFDVLLIFDEIISGMGRTGQMFAANTFGVTPDILCLGKGLSSGYAPLSATVWNERVQAAFWGPEGAGIEFGDGHTYGGHPLCCAAGLAVIRELLEGDWLPKVREKGQFLYARLQDMGERTGIFGEVRGKGMLWGIELAQDPASKTYFPAALRIGKQIGAEAQRRGLIIRHDPSWFAIAPPFVSTYDELEEMLAILQASIEAVLARV
ncbi:MAG: aspartate aminotransferase family protein [Chloroflexota bacterium]